MTRKRVLSIGQCGPDHYSISWTLRQHFGAEVVPASNSAEALGLLTKGPFDLILVNRILDADHTSGLQLIKQLKRLGSRARSNADHAGQQSRGCTATSDSAGRSPRIREGFFDRRFPCRSVAPAARR